MVSGNYYTDMALEAAELGGYLESLGVKTKNLEGGIVRYRVDIRTEAQSKALGKRKGLYYTLDLKESIDNNKTFKALITAIKGCLVEAAAPDIRSKPTVLVVGLGNRNITADALGAEVVERLIITRPYFESGRGDVSGYTNLCAVTPGVYGLTGIESLDIIKGVTNEIKPDIIIAVDSLAAAKASRLYSSFQITTAGIEPGSGLDNRRPMLNRETLAAPVISIGVPLALYARSLLSEGIRLYAAEGGTKPSASLLLETSKTVLTDKNLNMVVTPKAIDKIVGRCADVIAGAINSAFQHVPFKTDKLGL